jgi:hypothetical protein
MELKFPATCPSQQRYLLTFPSTDCFNIVEVTQNFLLKHAQLFLVLRRVIIMMILLTDLYNVTDVDINKQLK